jgi:RHS repeat-associated protein
VTNRNYIHGARVDEIVKSITYGAGGQEAYHHYDARGHCVLLTTSTGNILEQYEYDAFGYPYFYNSTAQHLTSSSFGNRFLFTGREWLSELKLYDYRNRMYQPELGRFMQPDPKQFAAGDYNLYRYCHNDPVNRSDPLGLELLGDNVPFEKVDFVTIPGGEKYGAISWALRPNLTTQSVAGGYTAGIRGLDVVIKKAQIATRVKIKGEPVARTRTPDMIEATREHEQDLHKEIGRQFDKDNQTRDFSKVYRSQEEAKREARLQLEKDWEKAHKHDKRFENVMKREAIR